MVKENKKRVIGKNELLILLGTLIFMGLLGFIFAATGNTVFGDNPVPGGNYSTFILLNCSSNITSDNAIYALNATYYFNASGGTAHNSTVISMNLTDAVKNQSNNGSAWFFNITLDTSWLADGKTYNISCRVNNGTESAMNWTSVTNITIDHTPPAVAFVATNISHNGNYTAIENFTVNVTVTDATIGMANSSGAFFNGSSAVSIGSGSVYMNITNSSGGPAPIVGNWTRMLTRNGTVGAYNASLDISGLPDGKYNITIWANDSSYLNQVNQTGSITKSNLNNTQRIQITVDRTPPTVPTLVNTTDTTTTKIVATITAADTITNLSSSGISECVVDSSSGWAVTKSTSQNLYTLTHTGLSCGTSYTYIATCYDQVRNYNVSLPTSLSTKSCSISDSGSGGGTTPTTTTAVEKTFTLNILPSQEGVLSGFQDSVGVNEIKIRVNAEADNVKVTVKKFDTQPSIITVPKTGQVHKYIQIITENLGNKLLGATLEFKVQKNWLADNGIDKANVALFRLDETAGKWNELPSVYKEEDTTYYYFEAQLDSFSFFAISEKSVVLPGEPEPTEELPSVTFIKKNWVWFAVGAAVLLVLIGSGVLIGKKRKR